MERLSKRFGALLIHAKSLLIYLAVGILSVCLVPVLYERQTLIPEFLAAAGLGGTLAYVRFGFVGIREECPECGDRIGLGAVWCRSHRGFQSRFTYPVLQLVLALVLAYAVAVTMSLTVTSIDIVRPLGSQLYNTVDPAYGYFLGYFIIYEIIALIPVPFVFANLLRGFARVSVFLRF